MSRHMRSIVKPKGVYQVNLLQYKTKHCKNAGKNIRPLIQFVLKQTEYKRINTSTIFENDWYYHRLYVANKKNVIITKKVRINIL